MPNEIKRIFNDFAICETFGWSIKTLYKQPRKRVKEFSIIIDERNRIQSEESKKMKLRGK